jgi:hypothetical protein
MCSAASVMKARVAGDSAPFSRVIKAKCSPIRGSRETQPSLSLSNIGWPTKNETRESPTPRAASSTAWVWNSTSAIGKIETPACWARAVNDVRNGSEFDQRASDRISGRSASSSTVTGSRSRDGSALT